MKATSKNRVGILSDIQILKKCIWLSINIRFGQDQIKINSKLTKIFVLNTDNAIQGFRKYIDNEINNEELKECWVF